MERDEFFQQATLPTMPDEFSTTLRRNPDNTDPQQTFSVEAFEGVGYQLHDFVMARTLAYLRREGRAPKGLRAELRIVWDDDRSDSQIEQEELNPWYALTDDGGEMVPVDGTHRLSTFLTERRERYAD